MAKVELRNIIKSYDGDTNVVKGINLTIQDKEFLVLVGPSGCGKTTTLRMIAGLEDITDGELFINDEKMNEIHPKDRDIAMVFQNYALYPHMTVRGNMEFGLKLRKVAPNIINERVKFASEVLGMDDLLDRKPKQLSGGQRQRVALGRAIVRQPKVFLMDEPLSNLDAKLRVQTRGEIKKLHAKLDATIVYVTHDQTEAMTLGDRIAVMNDGIIQQCESPIKVFDEPKNVFIAGFIGSPSMNIIKGYVKPSGDNFLFEGDNFTLKLPSSLQEELQLAKNKETFLGIRPTDIHDKSALPWLNLEEEQPVNVSMDFSEKLGAENFLYTNCGNQKLTLHVDPHIDFKTSHEFPVYFDLNKMHLFDSQTLKAII